MIQTYPTDCIQGFIGGQWWEETPNNTKERWRLGKALVRHVSAEAYEIIPKGRNKATEHSTADIEICRLDVSKRPPAMTDLPLAGMPVYQGERIAVQRAKFRPVLILATPGCTIEKSIREGLCRSIHCPTYIVAPFYGADQDGTRAGLSPEFVSRIKQFRYSQFFWDSLPIGGPNGSLLRFDQIQPIEPDLAAWVSTPFKLSEDAALILEDHLRWHITQTQPIVDSLIAYFRQAIQDRPV